MSSSYMSASGLCFISLVIECLLELYLKVTFIFLSSPMHTKWPQYD